MKVANIILLASLVMLFACGQSSNSGSPNSGSGVQGQFQAVCGLSNSSTAAMVVCINFQANSTANQNSCNGGSEYARYAPSGAGSSAYVAANGGGVSISCPTGASNPTVGTCVFSDRTVVYYSASWSLSNAQADCSSRSGQWVN